MALVDVPGLALGHQGAGVGVGLPQPPLEPVAKEVRLHLLGEVVHALSVALKDPLHELGAVEQNDHVLIELLPADALLVERPLDRWRGTL